METIKAKDLKAGMWFINPDVASRPATRVMTDPRVFDQTVYEGPHVIIDLDDRFQDPYVHSFPSDKELELVDMDLVLALEPLFS